MMPKRFRWIFIGLVLVGAVLLASFSIAFADAPVIVGPLHFEGTVPFGVNCGSFEIIDRYTQDITRKLFFDQTDSLYKIMVEVSGTDTFTNSLSGKAYSGSYHNTVIIDPALASGATNGVIFRLTVPGSGAVFLGVGRVVSDPQGNVSFEAGPHLGLDGDYAGLCVALT